MPSVPVLLTGYTTRKREKKQREKWGVGKNRDAYSFFCLKLSVKNLYARGLPQMPKEYISRIVFDEKHQVLALLKAKKVNAKPLLECNFEKVKRKGAEAGRKDRKKEKEKSGRPKNTKFLWLSEIAQKHR